MFGPCVRGEKVAATDLEGGHYVGEVLGLDVAADGVVQLQDAVLLVQFAMDDVCGGWGVC